MGTDKTASLSSTDKAMLVDINDERVPVSLHWTAENVADWICGPGTTQYKPCFLVNNIDGTKLIHVTMSTLPQMGITNYDHMKLIMECVHILLLGCSEPSFKRSIALPPRETLELYLEQKSVSGRRSSLMTYSQFEQCASNIMWQPSTLANVAFIFHPSERHLIRAIRK